MNLNHLATATVLTSILFVGCSSSPPGEEDNGTSAAIENRVPVTPASVNPATQDLNISEAILSNDTLPPGLDNLPLPPMPGAETGNVNGSFGAPQIPNHNANITLPKNPVGKNSGFLAPPSVPQLPFGPDGLPTFPGTNNDGKPIPGIEADGVNLNFAPPSNQ
jgi:hypothetical protein